MTNVQNEKKFISLLDVLAVVFGSDIYNTNNPDHKKALLTYNSIKSIPDESFVKGLKRFCEEFEYGNWQPASLINIVRQEHRNYLEGKRMEIEKSEYEKEKEILEREKKRREQRYNALKSEIKGKLYPGLILLPEPVMGGISSENPIYSVPKLILILNETECKISYENERIKTISIDEMLFHSIVWEYDLKINCVV